MKVVNEMNIKEVIMMSFILCVSAILQSMIVQKS